MDRRSRQAQTTVDRYFYKFISCYVQAKYNEAYKEAVALLERARAENPGVKDLVKTATYMRDVHPQMGIPRYYLNRNLKHRQQQPQQPNPHNLKQMVLCIPLTSSKAPTTTQTVEPVQLAEAPTSTQSVEPVQLAEAPTSTQSVEPVQLAEAPTSTQSVEPVQLAEAPTSTQSVEPVQLAEPPTSTQSAEAVHLPLSDEIYEGLLKELQADPDVANILDNFSMDSMDTTADVLDPELSKIHDSFPFDNTFDDGMVFWEDGITPLEQEVETMLNKTV